MKKKSQDTRSLESAAKHAGLSSELRDQELLRRAIAISAASVAHGGRPFGAVVCDGDGRIVAEAVAPIDPRDWTAHSEMQALRAASAVEMRANRNTEVPFLDC
jgi:tRNA(Arg) A34 adenosine deaminase TadA